MEKETLLKKLDEIFKDANPHYLSLKRIVQKFIGEYSPDIDTYMIGVIKGDEDFFLPDPFEIINLLQGIIKGIGIENVEVSVGSEGTEIKLTKPS